MAGFSFHLFTELGTYQLLRGERLFEALLARGCQPRLLAIHYTGTGSASFTELGGAPDNEFDGTTTAASVFVESASADDDAGNAAGHAHEVTVLGIDENGAVTTEAVALDGTTAVETSTKWKRIWHASVTNWGTGGADAADAITVGDDSGPTTTYLTIAAGTNESNGASLWLPENVALMIYNAGLHLLDASIANDRDGTAVRVSWTACDHANSGRSTGTDPDNAAIGAGVTVESSTVLEKWPLPLPLYGSDNGNVLLAESKINNGVDFAVHFQFLVWSVTTANQIV
jgi:hypothetical protein